MNVANRKLIENAVLLIENNLKSGLSLDCMADQLCISKYHLHRLFKAITGNPLMAYVRGRKLTSSLYELRKDDLKIIDIACEYHFSYEQSYERAFKQMFGITPSSFRQQNCELPIVPRVDTTLLNDISTGIILPPVYCTKPRFHLAGLKILTNHKENYDTSVANRNALEFYYKRRPELENVINEHIYYGLVIYFNFYEADYYMPSVEVSIPFENYRDFTCQTIEQSDYAVFRYVGFHSPQELTIKQLVEVYEVIETVWMPKTSFELLHQYHFERMDQRICREDYCEVDLYYPIKYI